MRDYRLVVYVTTVWTAAEFVILEVGFAHFLLIYKNCAIWKIRDYTLLYLFNSSNPQCLPNTSLWSIYDKTKNGIIHLELHSFDLEHFRSQFILPKHYRFHRLATRSELRDFMYNFGVFWREEIYNYRLCVFLVIDFEENIYIKSCELLYLFIERFNLFVY